jgi:two-component system sensor histidine kinase CpxA
MRSLYTRILLASFGTLLVSLAAFLTISVTVGFDERLANFRNLFVLHLEGAVRIYERDGTDGLAAFLTRLDRDFTATHYMVDSNHRDLVSGNIRPPVTPPSTRFGSLRRAVRRLLRLPNTFEVTSADGRYRMVYVDARPWENVPAQLPYYLAVLIGSALMYSLVAVGIASALKTISRTADRFGRGDLGARVPFPDRGDEIGSLARSFNDMATRIETLLVAERRLLQDVSHELRSPLARLEFAAELARTAPNRAAAIDRMQKELDCLSGLVDSLIDVTRAEGDPQARQIERVRVSDVLDEVVESCSLDAEARGCRILVTGSSSATIYGDRELLRRAFDNVVRNSLQHSPQGGTIEVAFRDAGGDTEIGVRDFGPGVPDEMLPRIFEPFFRVESAKNANGVGLGLSIVRRIVQLHHGTLRAENTDPGLRVTITMPRAA